MPPRLNPPSKAISAILRLRKPHSPNRHYATATATVSLSSSSVANYQAIPIRQYPSTQPPSVKAPERRKSQLIRQYASLLRSTPVMLIFQHNNMKAQEWMAIQRELMVALQKTDDSPLAHEKLIAAPAATFKIIKTGLFAAALKLTEFYKPGARGEKFTHILSETAHKAMKANRRKKLALEPLLAGPLAVLFLPIASPLHLATVLSIMSPSPPQFPAPTRKANPGWHDMTMQSGLQKLLFLGARINGRVLDTEGVKWVGSIEGGHFGLRSQLVGLLANAGGAALVGALEGGSRNLYFTLEGRRQMLEEEANGGKKTDE